LSFSLTVIEITPTGNLLFKKNSSFTYIEEHGKCGQYSKLRLKASTLQLLYTAMQMHRTVSIIRFAVLQKKVINYFIIFNSKAVAKRIHNRVASTYKS
jgi:hypothetical protein